MWVLAVDAAALLVGTAFLAGVTRSLWRQARSLLRSLGEAGGTAPPPRLAGRR